MLTAGMEQKGVWGQVGPRISLEEARALDKLASLDSDAPVLERRPSGAESLNCGDNEVGVPADHVSHGCMDLQLWHLEVG